MADPASARRAADIEKAFAAIGDLLSEPHDLDAPPALLATGMWAKEDADAPFWSEAGLYGRVGKEAARTLLVRHRRATEALDLLRDLLAEPQEPKPMPLDLASIPIHFVGALPRGRIFMHPDTPKTGVRDPWPPAFVSTLTLHGPVAEQQEPAPSAAVREAAEAARLDLMSYDEAVTGDEKRHALMRCKNALRDVLRTIDSARDARRGGGA